jgi:hypothetical protein
MRPFRRVKMLLALALAPHHLVQQCTQAQEAGQAPLLQHESSLSFEDE